MSTRDLPNHGEISFDNVQRSGYYLQEYVLQYSHHQQVITWWCGIWAWKKGDGQFFSRIIGSWSFSITGQFYAILKQTHQKTTRIHDKPWFPTISFYHLSRQFIAIVFLSSTYHIKLVNANIIVIVLILLVVYPSIPWCPNCLPIIPPEWSSTSCNGCAIADHVELQSRWRPGSILDGDARNWGWVKTFKTHQNPGEHHSIAGNQMLIPSHSPLANGRHWSRTIF